MKKLSKLFIAATLTLCVFSSNNAKAQTVPINAFRFGIGVEGGVPTYQISGASNAYLGATARLQYGLAKSFALTLTSGYYDFIGNSYHASMGMVPVKLGFKAFVTRGFYLSGEAGAGFETQNAAVYKNLDSGIPKSTKLILAPGLGYATKSWDIGLRFESFTGQNYNYGLVGLRVAYGFGL